jgi:hypothetical protein
MISSINEVVFTPLVYIIISTLDLKGLAHLLRHSESTQRLNSSSISVLFFTPIHSISLVSGTTILEMKEQGLLQMHSIRILLYKNFGLSIYRIDIFYTSPALIAIRLEIVVLNLWQWLVKLIEVFRFCRKRADRDSSHLIGPPRLNDNNFSHDGTRAIADMLKLNSTITCLLSVNFEFLTIHLHHSLQDNNLGDEGIISITTSLRVNKTLRCLSSVKSVNIHLRFFS